MVAERQRVLLLLRSMRLVWLLWLLSFGILYALPLMVRRMVDEPWPWNRIVATPYWRGGDSVEFIASPWSVDTYFVLGVTAGVVLPWALHRVLARRIRSPFAFAPGASSPGRAYRAPRSWDIALVPRIAERRVWAYGCRLVVAMGIFLVPYTELLTSRFKENFGCVVYPYVRTPLEHIALTTVLLAVAIVHVPTSRLIFGRRPSDVLASCPGHARDMGRRVALVVSLH